MSKNSPLLFLSLVMFINAISYGTIIPLIYPYASRFGMNPFQVSLLMVSFSAAQFLATPLLGRLSDKYGRKPLLLICLFGSSVSLLVFALARTVLMLFISRIIDGLTGGNISVAQAVIADTTKGSDRAKAFGIIGASFGFGFLIGPAIGGLLSGFGLSVPFLFASILALIGGIFGFLTLKETAPLTLVPAKEPLINIKKLVGALFTPYMGLILLISLISSIGQSSWIIGFQSFTNYVLKLTPKEIGLIFSLIGLVGIIMQVFGIKLIIKLIGKPQKIMAYALGLGAMILVFIFFNLTLKIFIMAVIIFSIVTSPVLAMINTLLANGTKAEDQGSVMGLSQSYISLGQIIGPLLSGLVANIYIPSVFLLTAGLFAVCFLIASRIPEFVKEKADF